MTETSYDHHQENTFAVFDCASKKFTYPAGIQNIFDAVFDQRPLWQIFKEDGLSSETTAAQLQNTIEGIILENKPCVQYAKYVIRSADKQYNHYHVGFVYTTPGKEIIISFILIDEEADSFYALTKYDELTGLLSRKAFTKQIDKRLRSIKSFDNNKFMVVYFDVQRFKAINDMFGMTEGDSLLIHIADTIRSTVGSNGFGCRIGSDRFAYFTSVNPEGLDEEITSFFKDLADYNLPFEITCNAGVFIISDGSLSAGAIIDRAILAQASIKGSYTIRYKLYTEELRKDFLSEQEISGIMASALAEEQFIVYYQPQYNHSTGMLVGSEALVRWMHPETGLIPPGHFIPIFEKNGFITKLDLYVFDRVCRFIRVCLDNNIPVVPISTNLTRFDIFSPNFIESLEEARKKYNVPPKYIRVEITESAAIGNSEFINEAVRKLHSYGFIVEMDDFGSGYSSLNILKDINFDIIKLDMRFLQSDSCNSNRGGTILSSVVRMINWLNLPVIAEGVETIRQADFLKSIGCYYIQGYLYSKPLPQEQYENLLKKSDISSTISQAKLADSLDSGNFWSSESLETLIFNDFVGAAAIIDYYNGSIEMLRINQKYLKELGMNLSEKEIIKTNALSVFDDANKEIYLNTLNKAIETGEEQECETWRNMKSDCCGNERICIHSTVHLIGKSSTNHLFYVSIRNITNEKNTYTAILDSERRFIMASEQVNIYYWEYTVATKEMRPCFRCMRDLGLPAVLKNYPDSAIEMGIFPPETAEMYRDWHRQIAEGVEKLEAVIPLTVGRIPFHVRYTTEFDENGKPIKAYGSATLVVD